MSSNFIIKLTTYHLHFQKILKMTKRIQDFLFFQPSCKRIFLLSALFDCIVKFTLYYLHYKKIPKMTESVYKFFLCRLLPKLIELTYNFSLLWLSQKLLSLSRFSSDYIVKFISYHPYYKKNPKIVEAVYNIFV